MSNKKWGLLTLSLLLLSLVFFGLLTVFIDPFFHYHSPAPGIQYQLLNTKQRYLNDGISKNFPYDSMLTGTSMVENANTSTLDTLFGLDCIKVPYEGAGFKEADLNLRRAIAANPQLKTVFRSIDFYVLNNDKDDMLYDEAAFPNYLYNNKLIDDVNYLFNKSVFFDDTLGSLIYTASGGITTDFDSYSISAPESFGKQQVISSYTRDSSISTEQKHAPQDVLDKISANVLQNFRETVDANPQIDFYLFFSPCSIAHWDIMYRRGMVAYCTELECAAAKLLVDAPNVRLFAFDDCSEIVTDLDNYRDIAHYSSEISDKIFGMMSNNIYRLTEDNVEEYFVGVREYYMNFDYDRYLK